MEQTRLLCAIGASVLWTMTAAGQTANDDVLSGRLRDHIKDERFEVVTSVRGLPLGVRDALQALFGTQTLDIVDPGAELKTNEVIRNSKLALRRLVAAGCSADHHCLVYYERRSSDHTWLVALFQWTPAATRFEGGGHARGGMATIDEVRKALVSGAVKGPVRFW